MIEIRLAQDSFEQDIRPLMRAFLPREEMTVKMEEYCEPQETVYEEGMPQYELQVSHDDEEIKMWLRVWEQTGADEPVWESKVFQTTHHFPQPEPDRKIYKNILKKLLYNHQNKRVIISESTSV